MSTLLLRHSDVVRNLQSLTLLSDLREAFRTDALARTVAPQWARALLHAEGSTSVLFPGSLPGVPAYSVKVQARFSPPGSSVQSVLQLHDLASGGLLALMDSAHLTHVRDGVLGALAADVLARPEASRVAFLGAGPQAALHLKSLRLVRTLRQAFVYDPDVTLAAAFASRMYQQLSLPVRMAGSVQEAVEEADLVVVMNASRLSALQPELLRPGMHVTVLSTEESGKVELAPALVRRTTFVCDHRGQALSGGLRSAGLSEESIHAELGEIIAGLRPGRTSPEQLTLFAGVGLPFQDLAAAWHIYQAALGDEDVQRLDFGT